MFQEIIDDSSEALKGEDKLPALTAGERVPWAKARKAYFSTGVNKASLTAIEKSSFVLVLDEEEYTYDPVSMNEVIWEGGTMGSCMLYYLGNMPHDSYTNAGGRCK